MPYVDLRKEGGAAIRRRRFLLSGEPNSRKTTGALTAPGVKAVISMPGEKGYDTVPTNDPKVIPFIWVEDEVKRGGNSAKVVQEVTNTSVDLITGKYGKVDSFIGDGVHKFFDYILDAITDGAYFSGDEFEAKLYSQAHRQFIGYLDKMMNSGIPVVIFTTWAESEADRAKKAGEKASDIPSHIYPALPGKMAKKIMGEFSAVFHCTLKMPSNPKPGDELQAAWQTRPHGDVWGAQVKGPSEIVKRIPTYIPGSVPAFEAAWDKAEREALAETAGPAKQGA